MKDFIMPPKVPLYWVNYSMEMEKNLRQKTSWHPTVRIKCEIAKVEAFLGSNPPWEVTLQLGVNTGDTRTYSGQFSHEEGQSGYDRVLKSLFQRLNDDVLIEAISSWIEKGKL